MGNHRIVIRTTGNTDDEVDHVVKTAARALMGHNATVEKVHHYHNNEFRDLTKDATGHEPYNSYDAYWETMPVDLSADKGEGS
jgi:hypothetical protein